MAGLHDRNETWADIRQLAWGWLLVVPFIALAAFGAQKLLGWATALWMGIGLVALMTLVLVIIVLGSLAVSLAHDWLERRSR